VEATGGASGPSTLDGVTVTDRGLLEAADDTTLDLQNTTVNALGGKVAAAAGSTILLDNATINHGTLTTAAGGGIETVAGSDSTLNAARISNGSTVTAVVGSTLTLTGTTTNNGTIAADGGSVTAGNLSGRGQIEIFSGATVTLGGSASNSVTFEDNSGSTLPSWFVLHDAQRFTGTVAGLGAADSIDLADFLSQDTSITRVTGTGAAGTTTNVTLTDHDPSNPSLLTLTLHLMNQFANQFGASASDYSLKSDSTPSHGTLFELASHG